MSDRTADERSTLPGAMLDYERPPDAHAARRPFPAAAAFAAFLTVLLLGGLGPVLVPVLAVGFLGLDAMQLDEKTARRRIVGFDTILMIAAAIGLAMPRRRGIAAGVAIAAAVVALAEASTLLR